MSGRKPTKDEQSKSLERQRLLLTIGDLKGILEGRVLIYREKNNIPELTEYDEIFEDLYKGSLLSAPVWLLSQEVKAIYPEKKNFTEICVE